MFFTPEDQDKKQKVIDLVAEYIKNRDTFKNNLEQQDRNSDEDLKLLKGRVNLLKENKYLLAVAGESNSGKSTFINGLLKQQILPTGTLQCTSTIIQILDTDNKQDESKVYLKIKYADEHETTIDKDISDIQEKLREVAAIPEEYRSLPILQLDEFLKKNKGNKITDESFRDFIDSAKLKNIYNLGQENFESQLRTYLETYRDLSQIPEEITVGYPLGFDFGELRIVDTPGVNALGGLQEATFEYLNQANAIIFIHSIQNNIDGKKFNEFVNNSIYKKNLKNIFIFLTYKALSTTEAMTTTLTQARKLFQGVEEEKIIAVDSMLKIIYEKLKQEQKTLEELHRADEQFQKLIAPYLSPYIFSKATIDAQAKENIAQKIYEDSNYQNVEYLLREFSKKAIDRELISIIEQVSGGYEEQKRIYEEQIGLLESKIDKSPEEFDQEIAKLKKDLDEYIRILNDFSSSRRSEYTGLDSEVKKEFDLLKDNYTTLLEEAYDDILIRKYVWDFDNDCKEKLNSLTIKLNEEYTKKMKEVGVEFKEKYNTIPPVISLEAVSKEAKKNAIETITIPGDRLERVLREGGLGFAAGAFAGVWGGPPGILLEGVVAGTVAAINAYFQAQRPRTEDQLNPEIYNLNLKQGSKQLISLTCDDMLNTISKLFEQYNNSFRNQLKVVVQSRQKHLNALQEKRKEIEPLHERQTEFTSQLTSVKKELNACQTLR